jgi:hypothetical protein
LIRLALTDALRAAISRCIWFEPPEHAIERPARVAAYILTYGTHEDTEALRAQLTDPDLRQLLDTAPPGVFDGRSWAYWNLVVGRFSPPPLPRRVLS